MLLSGAPRRDKKFLNQVGSSAGTHSDKGILKGKSDSVPIFFRIIKVG
jgi:hypothetical protein